MPYTAAAKDLMLDALRGAGGITHVGALDADPGKSFTGTASTDTITSAAHGYSNGDLVVVSGLTGGTGLVAGRPYYVIGSTANTFQVAVKTGGAAVDFTTDVSAGTVTRLVEISGGSPAYTRKSIAYNASANGTMDDSTNGAVLDIPAGATVDYIGQYSASSAGTLHVLSAVTPETFAGQGTYTVTDSDLDLLQGV